MTDSLFLGLGYLGAGFGIGLCVLGVGIGIGHLGSAALEGAARQPEATGELRTLMLIPAALIEGLGLFGLVLCLLLLQKAPTPVAADHNTPAATTQAH